MSPVVIVSIHIYMNVSNITLLKSNLIKGSSYIWSISIRRSRIRSILYHFEHLLCRALSLSVSFNLSHYTFCNLNLRIAPYTNTHIQRKQTDLADAKHIRISNLAHSLFRREWTFSIHQHYEALWSTINYNMQLKRANHIQWIRTS